METDTRISLLHLMPGDSLPSASGHRCHPPSCALGCAAAGSPPYSCGGCMTLYQITQLSRRVFLKNDLASQKGRRNLLLLRAVVMVGVDCLLWRGKPARQSTLGLACCWRGTAEQTRQTQHPAQRNHDSSSSSGLSFGSTKKGKKRIIPIYHGGIHRRHGLRRIKAI